MKILINFLVSFILIACCFAGSGNLKGRITEGKGKPLSGVTIIVLEDSLSAITDKNGYYEIKNISAGSHNVKIFKVGYSFKVLRNVIIDKQKTHILDVKLDTDLTLHQVVVLDKKLKIEESKANLPDLQNSESIGPLYFIAGGFESSYRSNPPNTEEYNKITDNIFKDVLKNPLSTFSADVDYGSYSNARRFLLQGKLPPKDAVRVEEFINYFQYDYPKPNNEHPLAIYTELSKCPWNKSNILLHIGIKGRELEAKNQKPSNLVFLIDVSGSMMPENKLPLLKRAFKMFTENLSDNDIVSIVVYAGSTGLVLPATRGNDKYKIIDALDRLQAGGSTAGGAGMVLAYKTAEENFIAEGNNRVMWATDGDFNVGVSNTGELVRFLEEKRSKGIFLTVLGFGEGNIKDNRLEQLADNGNGQYAFIDNILEAKKVLVDEIGATLFTIAKDVKIQVEFNPALVKEYRLVGYENRLLNAEDFNNDKKDAGEIGSGHSVTALYEVVPRKDNTKFSNDDLRYQDVSIKNSSGFHNEIGNIKIRYKLPTEDKSKLITKVVTKEIVKPTANFKFAAAVAMFGMHLRDSEFKGDTNLDLILNLAENGIGKDKTEYCSEFVKLVKLSANLHEYAGALE